MASGLGAGSGANVRDFQKTEGTAMASVETGQVGAQGTRDSLGTNSW